MKARNEWVRKHTKREKKKKDRGIVELMRIVRHFFKELPQWIDEIQDPRNESYIIYTQSDLVFMGLLKNICGVKSMRSMEECFNEEECIRTLRILSGDKDLIEMPHSDTLNYYLMMLSPESLSGIRKKMIKSLLRMKTFNQARAEDKYWRIILDGTGLFCFKEKHCENCLITTMTTEDGKKITRYYHKVLEAKLVLKENIVISIDTEFIENESEDVSKQDCELNAAERLLKRLKRDYPRLPICIQGDALYAAESVMRLCRENQWKYIFTQKETRQKLLAEGFEWICKEDGNQVTGIGKEKGTGTFANGVHEVAGKTETANIYQYQFTKTVKGVKETVTLCWVTNIDLSKKNIERMIATGRGRWKIENEGFNSQKNGIYDIEHLNSRNKTAMKNHYLLTQIADIIMQIYLAWSPLVKEIGQSIKNTSSRLLESFRKQLVTDEDVSYIKRYTTIYLE